jgi:Protein of unknown function (DUF5661)
VARSSSRNRPLVSEPKRFTTEEARQIGAEIGIDWTASPFSAEEFRAGLDIELEHGLQDPETNVTNDDPYVTGKIARAHLNEFADYYTRLERMEEQAKRDWSGERSS